VILVASSSTLVRIGCSRIVPPANADMMANADGEDAPHGKFDELDKCKLSSIFKHSMADWASE